MTITDSPRTDGTDTTRGTGAAALASGVLSGLIATFAMLTVFGFLRILLGISSPPESIPDRFAPLIPIKQFFELFMVFHGYNGLKQFGVLSILAGMTIVGLALGAFYASRVTRSLALPAREGRRVSPVGALAIALAVVWVLSLIIAAPVLIANYRGLSPGPATAATVIGWLLAYVTYGVVLVVIFRVLTGLNPVRASAIAVAPPIARRSIIAIAAVAVGTMATGGILRYLNTRAVFDYDGTQVHGTDLNPITPNDRFYSVTKNVADPNPTKAFWRLEVGGAVANGRIYAFDDLMALPPTEQETTLMCISNGVDGGLMSNARWRGVSLSTVLNAATLMPGIVEVKLTGADGYTDTIPFAKAMEPTTVLVYAMNGEPLSAKHGYPVRVIVPGMYGEKNVKWVTRIEPLVHPVKGFYEQQGWGPDFFVHVRARIDAPEGGHPIPAGMPADIRGIAHGGDRGVSRVEVSTDDGRTWQDAKIEYPGTAISWAFWRFPWRPTAPGDYHLVARATDGMGTVQAAEFHDIVPQGARGYHRLTVTVQ